MTWNTSIRVRLGYCDVRLRYRAFDRAFTAVLFCTTYLIHCRCRSVITRYRTATPLRIRSAGRFGHPHAPRRWNDLFCTVNKRRWRIIRHRSVFVLANNRYQSPPRRHCASTRLLGCCTNRYCLFRRANAYSVPALGSRSYRNLRRNKLRCDVYQRAVKQVGALSFIRFSWYQWVVP